MTAVCRPPEAVASMAGGGMTAASSAARDGVAAKATTASAPTAAAQSERRLNRRRDMGFPLGFPQRADRNWLAVYGGSRRSQSLRPPSLDVPRYARGRQLLHADRHVSVNGPRKSFRGFKALPGSENI